MGAIVTFIYLNGTQPEGGALGSENLTPTATVSPSSKITETVEKSSAPIEITLWHWYSSDTAEGMAFKKVLTSAQTDLPTIKITAVEVPYDELKNKYRSAVTSGGGPDILISTYDVVGEFANAGLIYY